MQMKIAVCDDEWVICSSLETLLLDIGKEADIKIDIDVFYSGKTLCEAIGKTTYNIIFLDIELPDMSGVMIGKYIRDKLHNEIVQIAYISSNDRYAMDLFEYRPINFLVKPLDYEKIKKVIEKYMVISNQISHIFSYTKGSDIYTVPTSDIIYLEKKNRKITVYSKNRIDEFYGSMEDVYSQLETGSFLFIHKSFIVNYNYITRMTYKEVVLVGDKILPISQSRRKGIRKKCMEMKLIKAKST